MKSAVNSDFIEPLPSRRGWQKRYAYASHGLRFELQARNESPYGSVRRVNREAAVDEGGILTGPSPSLGVQGAGCGQ